MLSWPQYEKAAPESALDDKRLALEVNDYGVVVGVGASPPSLFGFNPQAALGKQVSELIDLFSMWEKEGEWGGGRRRGRGRAQWRLGCIKHCCCTVLADGLACA